VGLIFKTGATRSKTVKNAKVSTNDSTQTNLTISFSANVYAVPDTISSLRLNPVNLDVDPKTLKQVVMVENHGKDKVKLSLAEKPLDQMKIKIKDSEIKPGQKGQIQFEWKGDFLKEDLKHVVTFETSDTTFKRFSVPYVVKGTDPAPPPPKQAAQPKSTEQLNAPIQSIIKGTQPPPTQEGQPQVAPKTTAPIQKTFQQSAKPIVPSKEKPFEQQIVQPGQAPQGAKPESTVVVPPKKGP
jgi:hypothetical protein